MYAFIGVIISLIIFYGLPVLYFRKGWMKRFFHDILHYHVPDENHLNRYSLTGICKYCGAKIKVDNNGNWYRYE